MQETRAKEASESSSESQESSSESQELESRKCENYTEPASTNPPPQRRLVSLKTEQTIKGPKFTVLTYNILADKWNESDRKHKACPAAALEWNNRKHKLVSEIIAYNADIICLQEVEEEHYKKYFLNQFRNHGYDGHYLAKPSGNPKEGCATFFLRERFSCMEEIEVVYGNQEFCNLVGEKLYLTGHDPQSYHPKSHSKPTQKTLRRFRANNIALILLLSFDSNLICVANTHVLANKDLPDVKMWQAYCLLHKLEEISMEKGNDDMPMVICGDFNLFPEAQPTVYCAYSAYFEQGVSDCGDENDDVMKRWMNPETKEPVFTHYASDFQETLDYIFYTHNNLEVEKLLEVVDWDTVSQAEDKYIPSSGKEKEIHHSGWDTADTSDLVEEWKKSYD
ncbi:carbon catabolite repressor protein 4 homolog 1-like [Cryptomeria japonica]|uniref:carbon catabolite repressor protein 4 homolog 1-like n=1 Tax=Cryptomeria japonica TaxID=3369 RepID=UPI0027DA6EC3|nr:carbon catabolite repressor protein 4 homolog 1-like [Cryptomeria japonica]